MHGEYSHATDSDKNRNCNGFRPRGVASANLRLNAAPRGSEAARDARHGAEPHERSAGDPPRARRPLSRAADAPTARSRAHMCTGAPHVAPAAALERHRGGCSCVLVDPGTGGMRAERGRQRQRPCDGDLPATLARVSGTGRGPRERRPRAARRARTLCQWCQCVRPQDRDEREVCA